MRANVAGATNRSRRRGAVGARMLVAAGLAGGGVLALAGGAMAASVPAVAFAGPTSCGVLHGRFGGDAPWTEIRFSSLPDVGGTKTGRAGGVTVTVIRTGPTSFNWRASDGIDLVWVNAGEPPHGSSAAYRYDPPAEATADTGLSGADGQNPLDHVLFCFDQDAPPSTAPPSTAPEEITTIPTTPATTAPATTSPPTTATATTKPSPTMTVTVRSVPSQGRPTPQTAAATPRDVTVTTVAVARLPETGAGSTLLMGLGLGLVAAGVASMVVVRRAPEDG